MSSKINRRDFLGAAGSLGVLGASSALFPHWMPKLAFRDQLQVETPGDVLVCIFLRGGMDGLSAVVPYAEGANYYDARPTQSIAEPGRDANSVVDLDGQFGLHPALGMLKEIYDDDDLAIVHATGSPDPTRSHLEAMTFMELGTPGEKKIGTGWIGRHLQTAAWQNDSPFRAVGMGAMVPQSLRGPVTPLAIQSIVDFHFKGREDEIRKLQKSLAALYTIEYTDPSLSRSADLVFDTIETLQGLDAENYVPAANAQYPDDNFGMGLRQIAQLVKAQVGLEVACVDLGGWDTHEYQGTLAEELVFNDAAVLAAVGDLSDWEHNTYFDRWEQVFYISLNYGIDEIYVAVREGDDGNYYIESLQDASVLEAEEQQELERNQAVELAWEAEGIWDVLQDYDNWTTYVEHQGGSQYSVAFVIENQELFYAIVDIENWEIVDSS